MLYSVRLSHCCVAAEFKWCGEVPVTGSRGDIFQGGDGKSRLIDLTRTTWGRPRWVKAEM